MTPEQLARQQIDAMLVAAGWAVQDYGSYNPGAAHGIALREVPLTSGRRDYLLIHDRRALGVIVAEADRRLSLIRVAESQVTANLARAQRLRQSILQAAFAMLAQAGQ